MTRITTDQQQRMKAAAGSAGAKLQAFHEALTPDEQLALDRAMRQVGAGAGEPADDAAGYSTSMAMIGMAARVAAILQMGTAPYAPPPLRDMP